MTARSAPGLTMTPSKDDRAYHYRVRMRRADAWLKRAVSEREAGDLDVAFILYWIAFNAAFATDVTPDFASEAPRTREEIRTYFQTLLDSDGSRDIRDAIRASAGRVEALVANRYLYEPYWLYMNGRSRNARWKEKFDREAARVRDALLRTDDDAALGTVLDLVFQRLKTLRNQLFHGGATWGGDRNRDSVGHGAHLMAALVPVFVKITRSNPGVDFGRPYYRPGLQQR